MVYLHAVSMRPEGFPPGKFRDGGACGSTERFNEAGRFPSRESAMGG